MSRQTLSRSKSQSATAERPAPPELAKPGLRIENWGASRHVFSGLREQIRPRAPVAVRGSVGTGDYDGIAVAVAHPAFPVVWPALSIRRVAVAGHYDFNLHFLGALHHRVEVVDLEPEQHAVAIGPVTWIANAAVMVLHFEAVQLQNEGAILDQLLVLLSAVGSAATQQALIPAAARFDIRDADKWLRSHRGSVTESCWLRTAFREQRLKHRPNCLGNDLRALRCRMDPVGLNRSRNVDEVFVDHGNQRDVVLGGKRLENLVKGADVVLTVVGGQRNAGEQDADVGFLQRGDDLVEVPAAAGQGQPAEAVVAAKLDNDNGGVQTQNVGEVGKS